jgi:uncharacterized membrane protein required for colicin V production
MKRILETFSKTAIAHILAVMIVFGCFVMLYLLMIKEIPKDNLSTVNQAVGFVFGCLAFIMGYFYGASKPSTKTD